jgi:uncharacterized membrane protein YraQ (UPF0718 family)
MGKLKSIWDKIKKWFKETGWPWLKKGSVQILNVIVVLFLYGQLDNVRSGQEAHVGLATVVAGLWVLVLAGYWAAKLFGFDKISLKRKK